MPARIITAQSITNSVKQFIIDHYGSGSSCSSSCGCGCGSSCESDCESSCGCGKSEECSCGCGCGSSCESDCESSCGCSNSGQSYSAYITNYSGYDINSSAGLLYSGMDQILVYTSNPISIYNGTVDYYDSNNNYTYGSSTINIPYDYAGITIQAFYSCGSSCGCGCGCGSSCGCGCSSGCGCGN